MHGVLVVDKPAGMSSHDALAPAKRAAGRRVRVGHAGTLDPFATGVLLVLLGDATRLMELALRLPKTYEATVAFGVATETLDPEGAETERVDPGAAPPPDLEAVLGRFVGEIEQVPPPHSALKVGGRRAYLLAREGVPVELPPRRVRIEEIEVLSIDWPLLRVRVRCGSGTYLRSLGRDLGAALGLPAHLAALRRTAIGPFRAESAGDPPAPPVALARAAGLEEVRLPPADVLVFAAGQFPAVARADAGPVAVLRESGDLLLGLGRIEAGRLRPVKVFAGARKEIGR